jgi:hypothetical protein
VNPHHIGTMGNGNRYRGRRCLKTLVNRQV